MNIEALNAEVDALKARKAAPLEKPLPKGVSSAADVLPEIQASMERARLRWATFCETMRPDFDAAAATLACEHHPDEHRPKLFEESAQQSYREGYFVAVYAACPACVAGDDKARQRRFWARRGMPERVTEATFGNFECPLSAQEKARADVEAWGRRRGVFLLLIGTQGTGKGHLAAASLKRQGDGLFITHADMIVDLRNSYTLGNTKALLDRWQGVKILVLDEFGLRSEGKDEAPMLYQVLADRYDSRRPTIITSNLALPELRDILGFRLLDRIQEDCATVVMRWESHRARK